jgi:hypothetical protein
MKLLHLAIVPLIALAVAATARGDNRWDYPAGRSGVNQVAAGRAGQLRVFDCQTPDSVETVILWYAERLGLAENNTLAVAASQGFDKLPKHKDTKFNTGFGHDTGDRSDHTQLIAHIAPAHAHVTLLHRPDLKRPSSITISIAETPTGASIHVIQPMQNGQ